MVPKLEELKEHLKKISLRIGNLSPESEPWEILVRGRVLDFIVGHLFGNENLPELPDGPMQGTFFWEKNERGLLFTPAQVPRYVVESFKDVKPLESVIDLETSSNLENFYELRQLWLEDDIENLFFNEELAPVVEPDDFGAPAAQLYVMPYKRWFRTKRGWRLATSAIPDPTIAIVRQFVG